MIKVINENAAPGETFTLTELEAFQRVGTALARELNKHDVYVVGMNINGSIVAVHADTDEEVTGNVATFLCFKGEHSDAMARMLEERVNDFAAWKTK